MTDPTQEPTPPPPTMPPAPQPIAEPGSSSTAAALPAATEQVTCSTCGAAYTLDQQAAGWAYEHSPAPCGHEWLKMQSAPLKFGIEAWALRAYLQEGGYALWVTLASEVAGHQGQRRPDDLYLYWGKSKPSHPHSYCVAPLATLWLYALGQGAMSEIELTTLANATPRTLVTLPWDTHFCSVATRHFMAAPLQRGNRRNPFAIQVSVEVSEPVPMPGRPGVWWVDVRMPNTRLELRQASVTGATPADAIVAGFQLAERTVRTLGSQPRERLN